MFHANNMNLLVFYHAIQIYYIIFKMAAIATTVLQETKPADWAAVILCLASFHVDYLKLRHFEKLAYLFKKRETHSFLNEI